MEVHDRPNVTLYETVCRIINPTVHLEQELGRYGKWVVLWDSSDGALDYTPFVSDDTPQMAWRAAYALLDRRKATEDRRAEA
jgi:hypothetical protein